jgi:hypothetical protein
MTGSRMDRYDFLSSIVLIVLAIGIIVESWRMERLEELNINPYTAPGLIPGLIGVLLLICGIALGVRAISRGGWRISFQNGMIRRTTRAVRARSIRRRRRGLHLCLHHSARRAIH